MAQARARGEALWREPRQTPVVATTPVAAAARNPAQKVFVVADASCGSACLDALDLWKQLGAVQVGVPTSADSLYMDIRPERLPSGLARISVPMKVFRGRPRGSNAPHLPDLPYSGDMRDSPALQGWLLAR
ncbi:MAG: hypothetical protein GAK31_00347 [Stenotrophomonas maltophilia]|uniref:Tail specific protease domain-containing protein n=1 Tax=Stenotrophomonas maltophilia TaxID=40324 RepID=A0A7V8FJ45_STEMA|nr:MAG: hypothetical protein GAK31_00347 [Stenotrophomonas maltophilia]